MSKDLFCCDMGYVVQNAVRFCMGLWIPRGVHRPQGFCWGWGNRNPPLTGAHERDSLRIAPLRSMCFEEE